jgi:hypothetical protein
MMLSEDILKDMREYISKVDWIYAKTYKTAPHEYTLRSAKPELEANFVRFVLLIRSEGYDDKFWNKSYHYLDIDSYKYWTMGESIEKTVLINRAHRTDNI